MKRHFIYKDTMATLIQEYGIQKVTEYLIVFFRMKEMYSSSRIVDKTVADISRAIDYDIKRLYVIIPLLQKHGMITREYTERGKRVLVLRSERNLTNERHEIIFFEIDRAKSKELQQLSIIARYTEYMTRTQQYAINKQSKKKSQSENKGNTQKRGRKKYVVTNSYVTVTDAWLMSIWKISNSQTNKIKRILYKLGYFKLEQVILFIGVANKSMMNELREEVGGHCFVKKGSAYKHLGTSIKFGKYNGNNPYGFIPTTKQKVIK